jgi:dephospho-CoA kinase
MEQPTTARLGTKNFALPPRLIKRRLDVTAVADYCLRMKLLGLTGGVGMGKSACAELLRHRHIPVIDTDKLARDIVEPGQPALAEIEAAFGCDLVGSDGRLRRDLLAREVFGDPNARRKLEGILHPRIRQLWQQQVKTWRASPLPLGVVAIPLLFETGAEAECEAVLCVACSAGTQLGRLRTRGWSEEQSRQRIAAQWPIEQKMAKATHIIWTEGSLDIHAAQLDKILRTYA